MPPKIDFLDRPMRTPPSRPVVRVAVRAADPLLRAGLVVELRNKPGIALVSASDPNEGDHADVVVAMAGADLTDLPPSRVRLVLIADEAQPADLWAAVERGLVVLVPRSEATTPRLLRAITDAHNGRGDLPAEQLGMLLRSLSRLHEETLAPRDLTLTGLSKRETDVLRLLADGLDTGEIATALAYSERTVKNILHALLARLGLRNRTHAVAHALRHGLI